MSKPSPPAVPITPGPAHPPIDFGDPAQFRAWLSLLRQHVLDVVAVGEDASRPAPARMFSRFEHARRLEAEEAALLALLDAAEQGIVQAGDGFGCAP